MNNTSVAVVIGASGAIGNALVAQLAASGKYTSVLALSRRPLPAVSAGVTWVQVDVTDEASVAAAAAASASHGDLRLVVVASGLLHAAGIEPEKSWRSLDAAAMARVYAVNAIGPALVAKHFLSQLPRQGRAVFAALTARVGSIGDNQLGGWHSYRAAKAALNMLLKNCAIELARRTPQAICVGLHPGTVASSLSRPFQDNVAPGKLFSPSRSAAYLLSVIDRLELADSGKVLAWDGTHIPP